PISDVYSEIAGRKGIAVHSILAAKDLESGDLVEIDFRFLVKGKKENKIVSVIFQVDIATDTAMFGGIYVSMVVGSLERIELISPVSNLPLPIYDGSVGRRNLTELYGELLKEKYVTEKDISGITIYRKPPTVTITRDWINEKLGRVLNARA
ncbi:MAG: hypothetical protein QG650_889, partial [Patescibacteria group bacterium]|nr:hypothetical protein [Patescibacteria group bacterium]